MVPVVSLVLGIEAFSPQVDDELETVGQTSRAMANRVTEISADKQDVPQEPWIP